jgi:hypothetical protein
MFLMNATAKYVRIASKATGSNVQVRLYFKSTLGSKNDVFILKTEDAVRVVKRDSLRRRYNAKK